MRQDQQSLAPTHKMFFNKEKFFYFKRFSFSQVKNDVFSFKQKYMGIIVIQYF